MMKLQEHEKKMFKFLIFAMSAFLAGVGVLVAAIWLINFCR
jgi:hypothetical protein